MARIIKIIYEPRPLLPASKLKNNKLNQNCQWIRIQKKKSNYLKVKDLSQTFIKVCEKLCDENDEIQKSLKNIEPQNES